MKRPLKNNFIKDIYKFDFQEAGLSKKVSHPGEILKNLWLDELGYSQSHF